MEDRQEAYLDLVRALLECEGGTEADILAAYPKLVDEKLVMTLLGVAQMMAEENDPESASTIEWLNNFAGQLAQALGLGSEPNSEDAESQLDFLMTVFQAITDCNGNPQVIYLLFRDNLTHLDESVIPLLTNWSQTKFNKVDEVSRQFAAVFVMFANLIAQFPLGNRLVNLEIAIACYGLALSFYTRDAYPEHWAGIQMNLATTYRNRIRGERAANLEIAIECYGLALSVYTREAFPEDWAMTQMNLANAYQNRIRGKRAANLEIAIECYQLALSVRTRDAYPKDWAMTQNNLAAAYENRIRGKRVANLEIAIECYQLALSVYTREAFPEGWAMTQNNLAIAYSQRIRGDQENNLEIAIECSRLALSVYTLDAYPEKWAGNQNNLATTYLDRIRGERAANLEVAIKCYRLALSVYTREAFPEDWAMTQMNLANVHQNLIRGNRAANLEEAIEHYRLALSVYTREAFPENWAMTQMNLANAYQNLIRGNRAANLEEAIKHYRLALSVRTRNAYPKDWAKTQMNLAILYGQQGKNELAIDHYQQALTIFKPATFPINALKANRGLGNIYFTQGEWQLAIDAYAVAIDAAETSRNWATNEDERQRIIREAISVYEHTIQAYINLGRIDLAITTSERARSRQLVDFMRTNDLYPQGKVPERVEAYVAVTKALQQHHQTDLPTDERSFATTSRSYTRSERAAVIALETERQTILQEIRQEDAIAAGQMEIIPIEFTTIQGLIKTPNTAILSFYTTDDDTHIFIITQTGTPQIFTLPGEGFQTFQQWLNQQWSLPYQLLDSKANIEKMSPEEQQEFFDRINNIDKTLLTSSWRDRMNANLAAIADRLQLPQLIDRLPDGITELVIVPHLTLHQIPFAALPLNPIQTEASDRNPLLTSTTLSSASLTERSRSERSRTDGLGGSFLGDSFTIRYVPSCQILQYCTDRPSIESPCHGTVADTDGTLPGSGFESDRVAEIYQILDEFRLRGKQASKANYLNLLTNVNNLLSSHHASSRLDRPKESCLKLADDVLTLGELLTNTNAYLNLNEIFLSCCETHLGDSTITDDILTLATGFLCAGARSVIGTLWRVNDLATSIFTIHYYQQRQDGFSRSEAIGLSQSYLRNLTKEQIAPFQTSLIAYAHKIKAEYKNNAELRDTYHAALDLQELLEKFFTIDSLSETLRERPFADPYFWAGFTCQGL